MRGCFGRDQSNETRTVQIEDFPQGYPRYSALIAASNRLHICRRFSHLRSRLLLLKQDRLSVLEGQLNKVDREEKAPLFLACHRRDQNNERSSILAHIDDALADYDALIERNRRMLRYEGAQPRDVLSLRNWINGNACLARNETRYLEHGRGLLGASLSADTAATSLEAWVEDGLIRAYKFLDKRPAGNASNDSHVFIFRGSLIPRIARGLIASLVIAILLIPPVVCLLFSTVTSRVLTIVASIGCFIATLSAFTRAKPIEIAVAGATYTSVLIVFISNVNQNMQ